MFSLVFWIIVLTWVIPFAVRMYKRSQQRRTNNGQPGGRFQQGGYPGNLPGHISGQYPQYPDQPQVPVTQPAPAPYSQAGPPSAVPAPAPPEPEGYRARKLAELDQKFSDGKIAMEEYMKLRQEIMNG